MEDRCDLDPLHETSKSWSAWIPRSESNRPKIVSEKFILMTNQLYEAAIFFRIRDWLVYSFSRRSPVLCETYSGVFVSFCLLWKELKGARFPR